MLRSLLDGRERVVRLAVLGAALVLLAKGVLRYRATAEDAQVAAASVRLMASARARGWSVDSLRSAAAEAALSRAFVSERASAPRATQAARVPAPPASSGTQPVLRGILGGPPWSAIIAGLPALPGAVVMRPGDTVAGFTVVRMARDTVVLRGGGRSWFVTWAR